jgi:hypothetical protein
MAVAARSIAILCDLRCATESAPVIVSECARKNKDAQHLPAWWELYAHRLFCPPRIRGKGPRLSPIEFGKPRLKALNDFLPGRPSLWPHRDRAHRFNRLRHLGAAAGVSLTLIRSGPRSR